MTVLAIDPRARRLSADEKRQFAEKGYIKGLPVFAPEGVAALQALFRELSSRLPPGTDINRVNMWHKASRSFHALCRTPAILDYVEDLIGPDFYQWGGQFFVKYPGDGSIVPWHQDAQYWPLAPRRTVTVWLAVFDADAANAAMQVVAGSHRAGNFVHHRNDDPNYVLEQEVDAAAIRRDDVVTLDLRAGEISLHDDGLLHGSGPNTSDRVRCGLTMRFSPTEVKADLAIWPTFEAYMARGTDRLHLNPAGPVPTGERFPTRKFQHSSEFA
ncbi:MAG: phytanoyl-CoA dioxygenase family protein [Alphaproteobacteria bacterium]|nr:phytanoyl-CoA dioxygenase family protein [Alphaproteobacteria bacterium]